MCLAFTWRVKDLNSSPHAFVASTLTRVQITSKTLRQTPLHNPGCAKTGIWHVDWLASNPQDLPVSLIVASVTIKGVYHRTWPLNFICMNVVALM